MGTYSPVAYSPGARNRCPHCLTVVKFEGARVSVTDNPVLLIDGSEESLRFTAVNCPQCGRLILTVETREQYSDYFKDEFVIWPLQNARPLVPEEVPSHIAADYKEAAAVLGLSPKASAALSRRCLRSVLCEEGGANQHDLSRQIDFVLPSLPNYIAENIDAIRNIGNFAAHPIKSQASGQIVDVESGEAEWNLDVLDQLFDFYYVQPALAKQKRDALDEKLKNAGKPPMKRC